MICDATRLHPVLDVGGDVPTTSSWGHGVAALRMLNTNTNSNNNNNDNKNNNNNSNCLSLVGTWSTF